MFGYFDYVGSIIATLGMVKRGDCDHIGSIIATHGMVKRVGIMTMLGV